MRRAAVCVLLACCAAASLAVPTERQLTFTPFHHSQPRWRPGSDELTYRRWFGWEGWDEMRWQICRSSRTNPTESALVDNTYDAERFSWSPDGAWLLYDRWDDSALAHQVFKRTRYQGVDIRLSQGQGRAVNAKWSPDGSAVVYQRVSEAGRNQIWRCQADGTAHVQLAPRHLWCLLGDGALGVSSVTASVAGDGCAGADSADFNGDGLADLAVANSLEGTVSIHLGDGSGSFERAYVYDVGDRPRDVICALLDGDDVVDLVVVDDNDGHYLYVMLGNGDGTFGSPQGVYTGAYPYAAAVGDFNGDGNLDIANVCRWWRRVAVQLGGGDGAFGSSIYTDVGHDFPCAVEAADLSGDGVLDLVVLNDADGSIDVLLGNGDGTFSVAGTYPTGAAPCGLAIGDVTGDGNLDIVVSEHDDDTVSVFAGDGAGSFGARQAAPTGDGPAGVAVADLDGDAALDVAVACPVPGDVYFFRGGASLQPSGGVPGGDGPSSLLSCDANGDGRADILVTNGETRLFHYYEPVWSPDGAWVAYRRGTRSATYQIYRVPAAGGVEVRLTDSAGDCRHPVWSPDGTAIAYDVTDEDDFPQIAVVNVSTSEEVVLTSGEHPHMRPCWSPDGARLCYERRDDTGYFQIYVVPAAGGDESALTSSPYDHRFPAWAPDGTVVYQRMDDDGHWQIFEVDPDE